MFLLALIFEFLIESLKGGYYSSQLNIADDLHSLRPSFELI